MPKKPELQIEDRPHADSEFCWCNPSVEHYEFGDLVIHNDPEEAKRKEN